MKVQDFLWVQKPDRNQSLLVPPLRGGYVRHSGLPPKSAPLGHPTNTKHKQNRLPDSCGLSFCGAIVGDYPNPRPQVPRTGRCAIRVRLPRPAPPTRNHRPRPGNRWPDGPLGPLGRRFGQRFSPFRQESPLPRSRPGSRGVPSPKAIGP